MAAKKTAKKAAKKPVADTKAAKASSKADEFRAKSADELSDQLGKLKKEQFNLRFQRANGQLEKTDRIRKVRKEIARVETVLTERHRTAG
jgi:large subunit ribosomal protein L29